MKKIIAISVFSAFVLGAASNASAFWGNDNDSECYGPYGKIPNCNPYDEWDPRYWMEGMDNTMNDDDDYYRGGYGGYGRPYGGGYGYRPYGGGYAPQQPYGYAPQQYAPQQYAPAPYGGGYNPYAAPAAPAPAAPQQ